MRFVVWCLFAGAITAAVASGTGLNIVAFVSGALSSASFLAAIKICAARREAEDSVLSRGLGEALDSLAAPELANPNAAFGSRVLDADAPGNTNYAPGRDTMWKAEEAEPEEWRPRRREDGL